MHSLEAVLPDDVAEMKSVSFPGIELLPSDLTDMSEHVRCQRVLGIVALLLRLNPHSWVLTTPGLDRRHDRHRHVLRDDDRPEAGDATLAGQPALELGDGLAKHGAQPRKCGLPVRDLLADHHHVVGRPVGGKQETISVGDQPARCANELIPAPVVLGQLAIACGVDDLQPPEPQQQESHGNEDHRLRDPEAQIDAVSDGGALECCVAVLSTPAGPLQA